jgi:rare lipoprotein A
VPARTGLRASLLVALSVAGVACAGNSTALRAGVVGTREQGKATYYSPRLAGHRTASGELYDPTRFTAAHPVIPFGTHVQVVRTDGVNRGVVVRINDRCAGGKKIIDLSQAAARQIDMLRAGVVRVQLEIVPPPRIHPPGR